MVDFKPFGQAVENQFTGMAKQNLFVVGGDNGGDALWEHYLKSFPEGTNPIYKQRCEHDCNCCKNFIRNLGRVVTLKDGKVTTVWDINADALETPYKEVAKAMAAWVRSQPLTRLFRSTEKSYGQKISRTMVDGKVHTWDHFFGEFKAPHFAGIRADEQRGQFAINVGVFRRALNELTLEAVNDVLDLIKDKALYRGEEHKTVLEGFKALKTKFLTLKTEYERNNFAFEHVNATGALIRNTAIGTLLVDLSDGKDLENAVKSFETKVAPMNYRRTTAIITPKMVENALKELRELNLEPALERRLARLSDVSINDVIWADSRFKSKMKGGLEDLLMAAATSAVPTNVEKNAIEIGVEEFFSKIVPKSSGIRLFLRSIHAGNFVTLTAPVHPDAGRLFTWDNNFAWSYDGNVTDSIQEKVKAAGGKINAKLRFSLAWFNYDDLDFHVMTPRGNHICFSNKAGVLDVDMNVSPTTRQPVENLAFNTLETGTYILWVKQFTKRETSDPGFTVEFADEVQVKQVSYKKGVVGEVHVGKFIVKNGKIDSYTLGPDILEGGSSIEKWGVKTETFVPVQTIMFSPNYWGENKIGNKHWIFALEGCKTAAPARGIYNEFLRGDLNKHRKVFELLGNKTQCPVTDDQISGIGFSSTKGESALFEVSKEGKTLRYNVKF